MRKILSFGIVALMVCVSFSLVSWDASSEEVSGPFAWRNTGYPPSQVIDQENPTHDDLTATVEHNNWISQSFTVGQSGDLTSVGVWLGVLSTNRVLRVQIWDVDASDIPTVSIGTPVEIPSVGEPGWLYVGLNEAIPVTAGQKYALVLSSNELQVCYWLRKNTDTYPGGVPRTSSNQGETWSAALAYDFTFRTFIGNLPGTIQKVAWHSSGSFALGVTGSDHIIHRYERISGTWSPFLNLNAGEVMHDIVFDAQPGYDRFYFVGQNANNGEPLAYEFQYDPVGGSNLWPKTLDGINGAFYGVERSNDGASDNKFLAVGQNFGTGIPIAYWYDQNTGWKQVSNGLISGDILTDASWDGGYYYYAVGRDGANRGVVYRFTIDSTTATKWHIPAIGSLNAIDWSPASIPEDYGVLVGEKGVGPGNVHTFDHNNLVTVWTSDDIFNDVHWHPHGDMAVIVGSDNAGNSGSVVIHYPASGSVASCTHMLPAGAPALFGVAVKGPSSPSSAIITGTGGSIILHSDSLDQDTSITVDVVFPRLYSIDLEDMGGTSRLDQQVPADAWYNITLVANYSEGWSNCIVEVRAWYDGGDIEADPGGSNYPLETVYNRNLAFNITWTVAASNAVVNYPDSDLEILSGLVENNNLGTPFPAPDDRNNHSIRIPLYLGNQVRAADGDGFVMRDPKFGQDKNAILVNPNSWDLEVTVRDAGNPTAFNTSYAEFGVHKLVSISVSGNPSGSAPPGASNVPLINPSRIIYSANTDYWVNVSIPNVGLGGDPFAADFIPATDVALANTNILASQEYTELNHTDYPTGRAFQGANVPWCVWGNRNEAVPYMPAPANGTTAFGPWGSNFNHYGNPSGDTLLSWWVTIQATTKEGVYSAVITITVES